MRTNQVKMDASIKTMQDKLDADMANIDADCDKRKTHMKTFNELMVRREAEREAYEEKMMAKWEAD
jgi:hypothetical protein